MKNTGEVNRNSTGAESWDMSNAPAFNANAEKVPNVIEEMQFWCQEYNAAEQQFARYAKDVNSSMLNTDEQNHYRETVAKYEDDIAYDWSKINSASKIAWATQLIRSDYELADTQGLGVVKPDETIEAATGIFYEERAKALNQQISASEQNENTIADQTVLRQTWRKVMDYIEAATDYDFLHRDYASYQNARRACHNNMIRHLNNLNQLAEKYGTARFTPREFMTNDFSYDQRRDRNSQLNLRANYDRETVLAYFRTVFESDFSTMEQRAARNSRDLQAGMTYYD